MHRLSKIFIIIFFCSFTAYAQPGNPGGDPDNPVPITGIEWLLGAGALLGIKRLVKRKKE